MKNNTITINRTNIMNIQEIANEIGALSRQLDSEVNKRYCEMSEYEKAKYMSAKRNLTMAQLDINKIFGE